MTDELTITHTLPIPSAREIREKVEAVQSNCRKRLLEGWQFERAQACLEVIRKYAEHDLVRDAYVRIYPDGESKGGYSYDGTHCIITFTENGWDIDAHRSGTYDRQTKEVAAVLEVPVSDSDDPDAARELRSELESEGWRKGSGSEMRITTGNMSK